MHTRECLFCPAAPDACTQLNVVMMDVVPCLTILQKRALHTLEDIEDAVRLTQPFVLTYGRQHKLIFLGRREHAYSRLPAQPHLSLSCFY